MKKMSIKVFRRLRRNLGTIDILVNNAGIIKRIPILEMQVADLSR